MRFADPKNDLAFKKIFGDETKKEILISFLNSVLDFKDNLAIADVSLANPYQVPRIPELKETILDINATNKNGEKFIVEMQNKNLGEFAKRSLYYTSKAYVQQLDTKANYKELKKVYFIGILNFNMFENKRYISRHLIINQETGTQDIEEFEFCFIELKKFDVKLESLNSIVDKWVYFIKHASSLEMIPKEFANIDEFQQAFAIASQQTWDKKELEVYEYISLKQFDDINAIDTAREEGIEKGIEQRNVEIAKNLLKAKVDFDTIGLSTGLTIEQIKKLRV
jgi:predicted transposase/invertase (TIGR01784 family)